MLKAILSATIVTGIAIACAIIASEAKAAEAQSANNFPSSESSEASSNRFQRIEIPVLEDFGVDTFHGIPLATSYYC